MRVAILHDHLSFVGGGERLVLTLAKALSADVFATDVNPDVPRRAGFPDVRVTEIARAAKTPLLRQGLQAAAFRRLRLPGYDAYVLSGNWAVAAARAHRPNLWYCHTPVRVFYDLREGFLAGLSPPRRAAARAWIRRMRPRYEEDVRSVERIVANSENVRARVKEYLGRPAEVVHPPVNVSRYRFESLGDFWLSVNRLSHEKRVPLQVEAFRGLPDERLLVAGGPGVGVDGRRFVRSLDPPRNVRFLGEVDDVRLRQLYATCRGLLATAEGEDFGMTPVEAMASGKAVLATDEGGYRETVVEGCTGFLLPPQADAFAAKIRSLDEAGLRAMRPACEARAKSFDEAIFVEKMRDVLRSIAA